MREISTSDQHQNLPNPDSHINISVVPSFKTEMSSDSKLLSGPFSGKLPERTWIELERPNAGQNDQYNQCSKPEALSTSSQLVGSTTNSVIRETQPELPVDDQKPSCVVPELVKKCLPIKGTDQGFPCIAGGGEFTRGIMERQSTNEIIPQDVDKFSTDISEFASNIPRCAFIKTKSIFTHQESLPSELLSVTSLESPNIQGSSKVRQNENPEGFVGIVETLDVKKLPTSNISFCYPDGQTTETLEKGFPSMFEVANEAWTAGEHGCKN